MPTVKTRDPYAQVTLKNGEQFQVIETFSTVLRHQKDALAEDRPMMDLMGPDGTRIAADPIEIISVKEIRRPTRNRADANGNGRKAKPKKTTKAKGKKIATTAKSRLDARREKGRRSTRQRTTA